MYRWIARTLFVVAAASVFTGGAAAQQNGTITGRVVLAETGAPLVSAQVSLVGTNIGGLTNADGRFTLPNVPSGTYTLHVTSLGYGADDRSVTLTAGMTATVTVEMKQQAIALPSVVVTALGIQKTEKSLGYAVQTVSSQALDRSPEVTLVNALAGQSANVQVTSSSGQPGASSRIVIRGESSFQGGGQPLFIIDGIPISMDLDSRGGNPLETGEMGSRGMDIDPNNIEEISVLRGAAATALYGSRAAFGAVVIRTKQGTPGTKPRFTFNSRVAMDVPILGGAQTVYTMGQDGYFCNATLRDQGGWCQPGHPGTNPNPLPNNVQHWGPHRDSIPQIVLDSVGDLRFRDPRRDFYQNGLTTENSINVAGSLPLGTYNFGVSHVDQEGIFPGSQLNRLNINANISANLSSALRTTTTVMYSNTENDTGTEGYSSLTRTLFLMPITRDISRAWMPDGSPVMFGSDSPHPVWQSMNEYNGSTTGRWIASQAFQLLLLPGITLSNRVGLDTYTDERVFYQNERPWRTLAGQQSGGSDQSKIYRRQINNDLVLTLDNRRLGESFTVSGLIGNNVNSRESSNITASGDNILVPDNYNISNFTTQNVSGNLATKQRLIGMYGQVTADYKDWAFLTLTGRNDWSSTLPKHGNSYFYPSAALSLVFTDMLGIQNHPVLQYGKLRLSWAKVGSDAPPYRLDTRYNTAGGGAAVNAQQQNACCGLSFPIPSQGGIAGYLQNQSLGNPDLKPESTVETEMGLELRLFDGRARTNMSYYDKKSYDQIFSVPSSASTGFTSITRNAGDLRNKGWEVTVDAWPIQTRDFNWNFTLNWSRNRSSVISLAPGVTSLYLAGYSWPQVRIMEGYEYGVIWGYGYRRNDAGQLMIGDDGWPLLDDTLKVLGETQQDWLGSLNTTFRYRGFSLSGLIDTKQGGDMLNFELQYTIPPGKAKITENRGDEFMWEGVNATTGDPNDVVLIRNRAFWQRFGQFDLHENQIEDASAWRLREATLQYALPRAFTQRYGVQALSMYVTGRNLKVWTPHSHGDPDGSNYGAANAGGSSYRFFTAPQTRSWTMGVRATF